MTTMEDLTKTQIVLLALLVSFITSIATGIITTSLLAEAPQGVTQTIDRVVERTVERVSPANPETVREIVIVKEEDAITASIEDNTGSLVRILSPRDGNGVENFYALGAVVSKQGHVLSDRRNVEQSAPYTVVLASGARYPASVVRASDTGSLVLFKIDAPTSVLNALTPAAFSKTDPKLGQTVVALQGRERNAVAVGRVLSLDAGAGTVLTDVGQAAETEGSPLLNLSGELVGLKTSNADLTLTAGLYTTATPLMKFVSDNI